MTVPPPPSEPSSPEPEDELSPEPGPDDVLPLLSELFDALWVTTAVSPEPSWPLSARTLARGSAAPIATALTRIARAAVAAARMLDLGTAVIGTAAVESRPVLERGDRSLGDVLDANRGSVVPGRVVRGLRSVVRDQASTARQRERADPDRGRLRRDGHGRRSVAAREETQQRLHPGHAAEPGGHVAEPLSEAHAGAQQERANRGAAERELVRNLAVAQAANLAQEKGLALGRRHPSDLVPDVGQLARAQDVHRGVCGRHLRRVAGRLRGRGALAKARVALVARDGEEPGARLARRGAVEQRPMR